ncbi:hypothetical protein AB0M28_36320 [Streptomyces sp. NPDC051940]|uniref:hypothetical protein n=1 Tax=Streptomyces sp. NPDC051940 TaxID=3155675 RepID=UPI00343EE777
MNKRGKAAAALAAACLIAGALGGVATADPSGTPQYRPLSGVGSDTTQDVMNGMANAITVNGTKVLGSYDATGSQNITTKDPATNPNCTIARPNGSGAGRTALVNELNRGFNCLDFSRSSSLNQAPTSPGLTYVPFAVDGLSYAVTPNSVLPRKLTLADLREIYHCNPDYIGTGTNAVTAYIPQAGSGTRSFWLGQMQVTEAQLPSLTCIKDNKNGAPVQEHDGRFMDSRSIVPFSIAQYQAQAAGTIADLRGSSLLGSVGGQTPTTLNSDFAIKRDVYNVIPTDKTATAPWSTVFVGPNALICQRTDVLKSYGFAPAANCGSQLPTG